MNINKFTVKNTEVELKKIHLGIYKGLELTKGGLGYLWGTQHGITVTCAVKLIIVTTVFKIKPWPLKHYVTQFRIKRACKINVPP